MTINIAAIKVFMVPDENGNIDYEKSAKKYLESLQAFEGLIAADEKAVKEAVATVFDTYRGTNVTNVGAFVLRELNPSPETYGEMKKRVDEYIKHNTGEIGEALLGMRKGLGGGVWRWSDKGASSKEAVNSKAAIETREKAKAAAAKTST